MFGTGTHLRVGERGAALPLLALTISFFLLMAVLLVGITGRSVDRSRAQAAADAAALAGALEGRTEAVALATMNGGVLIAFSTDGTTVSVTVSVDDVRAAATAERRVSSE